jgi:release factor glutamine methyltransferase
MAGRAQFLQSDWNEFSTWKERFPDILTPFDIIISNPPYIPTIELAGLEPEVRQHDPVLALDGGGDGLDAYRALVPLLRSGLLGPRGMVVLEHGAGQRAAVVSLLEAAFPPERIGEIRVFDDLAGHDRCVAIVLKCCA